VLLWLGCVVAFLTLVVLVLDERLSREHLLPAMAVLLGALAVAVTGAWLIHLGRFQPGWIYEPENLADAFQGLEHGALAEVAQALAHAGEEELEGIARRATLGRFSKILACIPGLCRQCSRTVPTQGFLFFRAIAVPWFMGTIYQWEWLRTRLCRECSSQAMRYFVGLDEGGGGAALIAGLLWLPWNLPQFLWSRRLPAPRGESRLDPATVHRLETHAPGIVEALRGGRSTPEVVVAAARKAGTSPGHAALFLVSYGELCRRLGSRA
jgi:hypothetical protein